MDTPQTAPPVTEVTEAVQKARDEALGVNVHSFDPSASPADKAAQARKATPAVTPVDMSAAPSLRKGELGQFTKDGGSSVASDVGTRGEKIAITTGAKAAEVESTKEKQSGEPLNDAERAARIEQDEGRVDENGVKSPPGAMPNKEAEKGKPREIPSWFAIGWNGQDKSFFLSPEDARERSILSDFFTDAYYGQWYHNAGIIVFAVVATHFVTLFGGGWGWMVIILAVCTTYYETSIKRVRRNVRDDMAREVAKKGLKTEVESAAWINSFLQRFWLIYEPILSATIVASVDQVLSVSTPAFLDSLRLTTFTLGTKPPHIDHVRTFPDTDEDVVVMEWAVSFTPNDLADITHAASAKKVNPKVVLEIRIGKGIASIGKDIIVEDISFKGVMRVKLKLMNNYPHVKTVDLSFMHPPDFDFVLRPVGFDLNSVFPGLYSFIKSTVDSSIGPMLYDPNTFTLDLEQMLSGAPIDTAVGVLAVTIHSGKGLKGTKIGAGAPDPYVSISISNRAEFAKTQIKRNTSAPHWQETHFVLLNTLNDALTMKVFDYNDHRPDSDLGTVSFDLKSLADDGEQPDLIGEVILDGKPRGQVRYDLNYYPVLKPTKLADGTLEPVPETSESFASTSHIRRADDLNNQRVHRSQTLKRTANPVWEKAHEMLVTAKDSAVIGVEIVDDNSIRSDTKLGFCKVRLVDIFEANSKGNDWFPLSNARSGKVRITAEWKPVLMAGAINGAGAYTAPLGVIRFWFKRSRDLKNVESFTGGKSDPYARILSKGLVVARTMVQDNNLDPEYDEIVYVQVHSPRDTFVIEVMDYNHNTKDRTLGQTEFSVSGILAEGPDKRNKPWLSTGKVSKTEMLKSDNKRTVKGNIEFEAEFFPCTALKNVSFTSPDEMPSQAKITEVDEEESGAIEKTIEPLNGDNATVATANTAASADPSKPNGSGSNGGNKEEDEGITIPREQLLRTQTGVLAFQVISGNLSRKGARLEVLMDGGYWPCFSTERSRSAHNTWDEIGEVLIRELDFSTITLALNDAEKDTREDILAKLQIDMNDFLENTLDKPYTFTLLPTEGHSSRSTITIMSKYIPVDMQILPRESVNNSGVIRVDVLDARGLTSADRNGKSDPYAVFELNGERVHKTEVVKKSLAPVWNEKFEMQVPSREAAKFVVEVHDWDRVGASDKLGRAQIDLRDIEPFEPAERTVQLSDFKNASQTAGTIRIRMVFQPGFIYRSRKATSTFSAGRIGTTLGGGAMAVGGGIVGAGGAVGKAGVGAAGTVSKAGLHGVGTVGKVGVHGVGAVGKGVGAVGKGLFGLAHRGTKDGPPGSASMAELADADVEATGYSVPAADGVEVLATDTAPFPTSAGGAIVGAAGTLTVTVGDLSGGADPGEKKAVIVKLGSKTVLETHSHKAADSKVTYGETAAVKTPAEGDMELSFAVVHKKTFGGDKVFSSAVLPVWQHISPTAPATTVTLPLSGSHPGELVVSLSWIPVPAFLNSGSRAPSEADVRSLADSTAGGSPVGKTRSRFSSGRFGRHKDRETTPVAE
ncbi:tricalbin [Rhodotorula toruloides]|uniref:Tricalbin n=1 Tax=Rhodotorula toruloides TaxID=5286 RepID=A0A511KEU6_RHOTO|nr:tricalbin [Rhodotorula toruloides]